jgi:TonB-linked SusC/RagA family outer membrane protein
LVSLFFLSFQISYGQNITLKFKETPLKSILREIQKQSEYRFVYNDNLVNVNTPVTVNISATGIEKVLDEVLVKNNIEYKITGKQILLSPKAISTEKSPQTKNQVIGFVRDPEGNPLPGVTVQLDNSKEITSTDLSGRFEIKSATQGNVLKFSMIGMKNIILVTDNRKEYMIILEEDAIQLENVVVTGYQTLSRERSSGSFSVIRNTALESKTSSMNVVDRLEGLVPGLSVNMSAGGEKFLMRGLTSINSTKSPLVVIDGVPSTYDVVSSLVNPNDVESITFLKDATAASIWGASAANGVINITTKAGKSQVRKPKFSYNSFISFKGRPVYEYQKMMSSEDLVNAAKEVFSVTDYPWNTVTTSSSSARNPVIYPHEKILYDLNRGIINQTVADSRIDSLKNLNNREQIENFLTQNSLLTNHSLSFSGGSDFHTYYASYAYTGNNSWDKSSTSKHQINIRQDFKFTKDIKLDLTANLAYENGKQFLVTDLPATANNYLPYAMFSDNSGTPLSQAYLKRYEPFRKDAESKSQLNLDYIPLLENNYSQNGSTTLIARINAGLNINLFEGLQYQGKFQFQKGYIKNYSYYDKNSYKVRDELVYFTVAPASSTALPTYYLPTTGGHYQTNSTNNTSWTVRNQLLFDRTLGDKHQITSLAGTEVRGDLSVIHNTYRRGFDMQTQTYSPYDEKAISTTGVSTPIILIGSTSTNTLTSRAETFGEYDTRFFSLYANAAYTYNKRYTFNGSVRMDQSNLFGSNKSTQFKPIWSLGTSWNISKEDFCKSDVINNLNLRVTYGFGGNSPAPGSGGPYDILFPTNNPRFTEIGYVVALPANASLSWERTSTTNIGVDFSLLKNRISGSVDIYSKKTEELLGFIPLDPTTGWYYSYGNLGQINNDGFELMLNTRNISTKGFQWNTVFTLSYNENKLTELKRNTAMGFSNIISEQFIEGYPAYSLFGFDYIGLNGSGNPVARKADGGEATLSSHFSVKDPVFNGVAQPKWFGGMTNEFTYKGFTLSALVVYNLGHSMRRDVNQFYSDRVSTNLTQYFNDRWKVTGDEAFTDVPKYIANTSTSNSQRYLQIYTRAAQNIISASYAKLRDLTLSYSVTKNLANKIFMENLTIYGQVNNILLWKNNSFDIDPEYYNLRHGVRTEKMPPFVTIGVKVNFL